MSLPRAMADGVKAHLRGVLDPEVAKSAQAEHGDDIARPGAAVAQGIERGQAGTHQRGRVAGRQFGRHPRHRARRGDQVLRVAAVIGDPGDLAGHAGEELAPAAGVAMPAIAAVPADAHALAGLPVGDAGADRIDHPGHFMTGDAGVAELPDKSLLGERIAVADAACQDLDPHRRGTRFGDRPFHDFKGSVRARDLCRTHGSHDIPPTVCRHLSLSCRNIGRLLVALCLPDCWLAQRLHGFVGRQDRVG